MIWPGSSPSNFRSASHCPTHPGKCKWFPGDVKPMITWPGTCPALPSSGLFQWIIPGQSLMAGAVYTSHATTWQLFTERSRIYRYLVFGMKFIEFISVVRAIYLVVIFVIAGCSNGNSYTATPPSLRPPHTRPDQPWMLNETKNWTTSFLLSCFSMKKVDCRL